MTNQILVWDEGKDGKANMAMYRNTYLMVLSQDTKTGYLKPRMKYYYWASSTERDANGEMLRKIWWSRLEY